MVPVMVRLCCVMAPHPSLVGVMHYAAAALGDYSPVCSWPRLRIVA